MTLTPLPLAQIRPTGWLAARLRAAWEAGLPEGTTAWVRHALMVGEGKGNLLVRAWAKKGGDPTLAEPNPRDHRGPWAEEAVEAETAPALVWSDADGLRVAYYAPAVVKASVGGRVVQLELTRDSPDAVKAEVAVFPDEPLEFTLSLRIPEWASGCLVTGEGAAGAEAEDRDGWIELRRVWRRGDALSLTFDRIGPAAHD